MTGPYDPLELGRWEICGAGDARSIVEVRVDWRQALVDALLSVDVDSSKVADEFERLCLDPAYIEPDTTMERLRAEAAERKADREAFRAELKARREAASGSKTDRDPAALARAVPVSPKGIA